MKTLRISDEIYKIIEEKALTNFITKRQAAEAMILDFAKSSPEERKQQSIDRRDAWIMYRRKLEYFKIPKDLIQDIRFGWQAGFGAGWKLFQVRKLNSAFRRKV